MRNQKGITLIALVITIIVLLILAGVSIAMLTGDNGILTRTTEAKTDTAKAEVADKINLAINAEYANILANNEMSGYTPATTEPPAEEVIGTPAKIAEVNGISTADFDIKVGDTLQGSPDDSVEADKPIVLEIKPSTTGAYKEYATDTNLVGTITYDTTNGYTIDKAEVK